MRRARVRNGRRRHRRVFRLVRISGPVDRGHGQRTRRWDAGSTMTVMPDGFPASGISALRV
ncbi:hypothetical protein SUS17_1097 [Sphingomonas sp. S17]|nr:hypothetical protein SUS17_1097 [Sphingomonas sp. S17]